MTLPYQLRMMVDVALRDLGSITYLNTISETVVCLLTQFSCSPLAPSATPSRKSFNELPRSKLRGIQRHNTSFIPSPYPSPQGEGTSGKPATNGRSIKNPNKDSSSELKKSLHIIPQCGT